MGVPSSTCSPASTRSSVSSASETATDTRGMLMTKSPMGFSLLQGALYGVAKARRRRVDLRLQRGGSGVGDKPGAHPLDGCGQFAEQFGLQDRGDLCSWPGELDCVVDDHGSSGTVGGLDDCLDGEGDEGT